MKQAEYYLEKYRQAPTWQERRSAAEAYKAFYTTLSVDEQKQASAVMSVLWPGIEQRVSELEPLMQQAERLLARKEQFVPAGQ